MGNPLISFLGEDSSTPGWLEPWLLGPLGLQEKVPKWRNTDLTPNSLKRNLGTWEDQHSVWEEKEKPWFESPNLCPLGPHHSSPTLTNFNQNSQLSLIYRAGQSVSQWTATFPKLLVVEHFLMISFLHLGNVFLFLCPCITAVHSPCMSPFMFISLSHSSSFCLTVSLCVTSLCISPSLCFPFVLILSLSLSLNETSQRAEKQSARGGAWSPNQRSLWFLKKWSRSRAGPW